MRLFCSKNLAASMALAALTLLGMGSPAVADEAQNDTEELRIGIIGLDTSHVIAFTRILNSDDPPEHLEGVRVVAAYPGGSPDLPSSRDRVEGYTKQIREMGIEIVDSIDALLPKVDAVLLESVDGRVHWEQVQPVLKAGKPVFVDKPIAASLVEAIAIIELSHKLDVPLFSSSSSRFTEGYQEIVDDPKTGKVMGADVYNRTSPLPHHPDLFNYGIHGTELLFTLMGEGCQRVETVETPAFDHVTGEWEGGRVGTYRGIKAPIAAKLGAVVYGKKRTVYCNNYYDYKPLVNEIVTFFRTGKPPVPNSETVEILAFLTAAEQSKADNGKPVSIEAVIKEARAKAMKLVAEALEK